ncbi:hypothetical protein CAPTEDRAFT_219854 [Capitella teleta]|uniref:PWI domain-containing protein n=1 Tax=Capitella teleta TaxID=283909 RepID=R7TSD9_CAPTE|nr:hypothetical protein CAPTEDRAFT_219854 [Capitella teleta]|eukprot:ELT96574.1 hypothetical protein CAPTEDRAFT_219854 [Capitella teleta]
MSYPPRPPMGMPPGMGPPGMMPPYGYPMNMMPPMGMMPLGPPPQMSSNATISAAPVLNKPGSGNQTSDDKPPVTTVFVGNISDRAPDAMVRTMLQRCGNVLSWKRIQGASGKLQAFGFCEYEQPEATLRCIRLLNDWKIADKTLVVKVDAKTKSLLDEYKKKKKRKNGESNGTRGEEKEEGEADEDDGEVKDDDDLQDDLDEFTLREDRVAQAGLDAIMREYSEDLNKVPVVTTEVKDEKKELKKKLLKIEPLSRGEGIDDMELEDDKKDLINREIRSFRDKGEGDLMHDKDNKERDMRGSRKREPDHRDRGDRGDRRNKDRGERRQRMRSRDRDRDRDMEVEDEEEAYERRRQERRLREKEANYQELLKKWESRERKRAREYEKQEEREEEQRLEEDKEARRLKEFLEDYGDDRDDPKFYKGSALARRLKEREKEMELDERDRQREKDELEEIRRKLAEEGHPDVEAQMARIERERDEHLLPRMQSPQPPGPSEVMEQRPRSPSSPESDHDDPYPEDIVSRSPSLPVNTDSQISQSDIFNPSPAISSPAAISASVSPAEQPSKDSKPKRKKMTVGDVFNQEDDELEANARKKKLTKLDPEDLGPVLPFEHRPTTAEEKRRCIKNLIDRIPTGKDELFEYVLDWTMVDQALMAKRIKPWVNKKIVEYIGEEEQSLSDFICQKVMQHSTPLNVLQDISMVLDEEAEVFVVKMWRLLIYETEAKKLGLVK